MRFSLFNSAFYSIALALLTLVLSQTLWAHKDEQHTAPDTPQVLAPGYRPLSYPAPESGSYTLPKLGTAGNGSVLDANGNSLELSQLFQDHISLIAFIYTNCDDINGCPLTDVVLRQVQSKLSNEPQLASQVKILSLSFDPKRDTPKAIAQNQATVSAISHPHWRYLTTDSQTTLIPILNQYQQSIISEIDQNGNETGIFSHILRVFLIDKNKEIRNIYSTSFLHADTLLSDIKTLFQEQTTNAATPDTDTKTITTELQRSGDNKDGYDTTDYTTRSLALLERTGVPIDLIAHTQKSRLGLGALPIDEDSPLNADQVGLGRRLFYDRRLSLNNTISCAMCHIPEQGFTSNELATAVGVEGRSVKRNTPTLLNVGYLNRLFHDGREFSLENQIWEPLLADNEMAVPSPGYLINKLSAIEQYQQLFDKTFADQGITMQTIGQALASYQRTLIAGNSDFDRWLYQKDSNALSQSAANGFQLFSGKAGCTACHTVNQDQALFTNQQMHNTGIGFDRSMNPKPKSIKVQLAPGVYVDVDQKHIAASAEKLISDLGLYEITQDPIDRWKYKTPTLRNIALTAPYMHDGSLKTLAEVVTFYNQGGVPNPGLDPLIKPLSLSNQEQNDLVAFLQSLTSPEVITLVSDAFAAPIGDPTK